MARSNHGNLRGSSSAESADIRHHVHANFLQKSPSRCPTISQSHSQTHSSANSAGRSGPTNILAGWRQGRISKRMNGSLFPLVAFSCVCVLLFARASDKIHFGRGGQKRSSTLKNARLGFLEEEEKLIGVLNSLNSQGNRNGDSGRLRLTSNLVQVDATTQTTEESSLPKEIPKRVTGEEKSSQGEMVNLGKHPLNVDVASQLPGDKQAGVEEDGVPKRSILATMDEDLQRVDSQDKMSQIQLQEPRDSSSAVSQEDEPTLSASPSDSVVTSGANAAAPAPTPIGLPAKQENEGPCETTSERNARHVRNNVRKAMRAIPLPVLSKKASIALGIPCTPTWRLHVWQYFKARRWTHRDGPSVKKGIEEVCGQIRGMVGDIKRPDEEEPELPLCKGDINTVKKAETENMTAAVEQVHHQWGHCWPNQQPFSPRVQRHLPDLLRTSRLDASKRPSFGGIKWKFLVMSYTVEQLSKGKIHLTEAARLARYSNRILVLPKASYSRLSLARPLPVCNYLSLEPLVEHGVDWISPDVYLLLTSQFVPKRPSAKFLCLETTSLWRPCARYSEISSITEQIMAYSYWDLPTWNNMASFDLPWAPSVSPAKTQQMLKKWDDVDVVVYMKTTPALLGFSRPGSTVLADVMFPYAQHLHAKVDSLVDRLGWPFVALHFRSEFVVFTLGNSNKSHLIIDQMKGCSHQAALMALRVATQIGAKSIFIAADIPWTPLPPTITDNRTSANGSSNSSATTVTPVRAPQRSESWATMEKQFGRSRSLDIAEESLRYLRSRIPGSFMLDELDPSVNDLDPGEVAILDKLICAHADAFLGGIKMCGGMRAYDSDIIRQRGALHKSSLSVFRWTGIDPK